MAAATKKNQQTPPSPAPAAASTGGKAVVDPKFEWGEKAGSYVLRLALPGFRKDDFRVQVDGAGRLTVRGSRPTVTGPAGSLHKVFQLPATAAVDDITGRFEAGVLTLTVPKRDGAGAGAPATSIEEIKRKQPDVAKESKPNEEEIAKEDALKKKAMDEATNKAKSRKQEQQKKEDAKPKAPRARSAVASPPKKPDAAATTADKAQQQKKQEEEASKREQKQQKPASAPAKKDENVKPDAATAPPPKHDAVTGTDKAKKEVAPESLAEKVRRRSEEEGANAAPMSAAKRAKTDGEKKATAACGGWKERVQGELKVLTDMKWADGLLEAARNNKEVVAVGIAAFSLGLLVAHKLFRK